MSATVERPGQLAPKPRRRPNLAGFHLLGCALIIAGGGASASANGTGPAAVADRCELTELEAAKKSTEKLRLFGLVDPEPTKPGIWRRFQTEGLLEAAMKSGDVTASAHFWKQPDKTIRVSMAVSSHSGDWVQYLDYCFRADGTLARAVSRLNTFNAYHDAHDLGPISRKRDLVFDRCGIEVERKVHPLFDLKSKKPAPKGTSIMDHDDPKVSSVRDLPFFALAGKGELPSPPLQADGRVSGCDAAPIRR